MAERDDRDLDNYLRGGSRLSAAYREAAGEEPSAELDEVLLERARREVQVGPKVAWSPFTRSWSLPLALTAVLVVSVTVTLMMYDQAGEPLPVPALPTAVAPAPAPKARAPKGEAPARASPAPEAAPAAARPPAAPAPSTVKQEGVSVERQRAPAADTADEGKRTLSPKVSPAPASETVPSSPRAEDRGALAPRAKQETAADAGLGNDPDAWLRRVELLRKEGRHAEADALLAEFRRRFPDFPADRLPR